MDKRKTHFGVSKGLCGERGSWRTNRAAGVTCKTCAKMLQRAALVLSN
jgi:hypothetical protein